RPTVASTAVAAMLRIVLRPCGRAALDPFTPAGAPNQTAGSIETCIQRTGADPVLKRKQPREQLQNRSKHRQRRERKVLGYSDPGRGRLESEEIEGKDERDVVHADVA